MGEDIIFWVKIISFLVTMFVSFQIGRYFERSRLLRFLTKQGDRIEKVLDEVFSPPREPDHQAKEWQPWKAGYETKTPGGRMEKKYFLS